ncbi:MAG: hypothetical protein QXU98_13015, partial [Candidatus Parvarchaeota archaeon]
RKFLSGVGSFALIFIALVLSLSYLSFTILSSGSTLLAQSVSSHPVYVFGFIYDWISVLPNAIRLILNWGAYTVYAGPWVASYLANPLVSLLLYVPSFLSLLSAIFLKRKDFLFYILMIASIIAATTANPPAGKIFELLILKVGPLRAFYESDSYYPILVSFYSFFMPLTLYSFSRYLKKSGEKVKVDDGTHGRKQFWRGAELVVPIVIIILLTMYPLLVLHFAPLLKFYSDDPFYSVLISFLLLSSLTIFYYLYRKSRKGNEGRKQQKVLHIIKKIPADKLFVFSVIAILIFIAYPIYTGLIDESGPVMPVESHLPSYYINASNFLSAVDSNAPVMVFPGIYGFSQYEYDNHVWYQGIDLYPGIINNPSISNDQSGSYTLGRGDAYSVIGYVYGRPTSTIFGSSQNGDYASSSVNYAVNNASLVRWQCNYNSDSVIFVNSGTKINGSGALIYTINASVYSNNIGSHDLIGYFHTPLNISEYNYILLNMKSVVPTDTISIGLMNESGDFFEWFGATDFLPTIFPVSESTVPVFIGIGKNSPSLEDVKAVAISYNGYPGLPNNFNISLYSIKFIKSNVSEASVIARGMNVLGIKYAYVDTGIVDAYGAFNGAGYDSIFQSSNLYKKIFNEGTVTIYSYLGYQGPIQAFSNLANYSSEDSLLGNLFYNVSDSPPPLYGRNVAAFQGSTDSSILWWKEVSPTEYVIGVNFKGPFAIFFKEDYNSNWQAINSYGQVQTDHFEADGYGNGWVIYNNTSEIEIVYKGAAIYAGLVTTTVAVPFLMLIAFSLSYKRKRGDFN